jgi:hypothetical protein
MVLRGLGFLPIRYTTDKLEDPWALHADLAGQLAERRGRGGAAELAERRGRGGLPLAS